ncbi:MAG: hypothetical protein HYW27_03895, partial [Candidatus Aenigmarchaeota archaeon]|nr:hypothetical protein [Candidatus Aenigmarchaeota archaeon]
MIVYKNEACGHCNMYLSNLRVFLDGRGLEPYEEKQLINNPLTREEL